MENYCCFTVAVLFISPLIKPISAGICFPFLMWEINCPQETNNVTVQHPQLEKSNQNNNNCTFMCCTGTEALLLKVIVTSHYTQSLLLSHKTERKLHCFKLIKYLLLFSNSLQQYELNKMLLAVYFYIYLRFHFGFCS